MITWTKYSRHWASGRAAKTTAHCQNQRHGSISETLVKPGKGFTDDSGDELDLFACLKLVD